VKRKIVRFEAVSSFAHGEERRVAVLECGHEISIGEEIPRGEAHLVEVMECMACGPEDPRNPNNWKQALVIKLWYEEKVIYRVELPCEVGTDEEGGFPVVQPHDMTRERPMSYDRITVEMKFRHGVEGA
jgi:hypothetical protein